MRSYMATAAKHGRRLNVLTELTSETSGFRQPPEQSRSEQRLQLVELGRAEPAARPTGSRGDQRRPAAGGQRPPPAVSRHPGHPKPGRDLPVAGSSSIHSAAASRTRSRRARCSAVSPPPSGYLIPPA